jgi:hypothetical protein
MCGRGKCSVSSQQVKQVGKVKEVSEPIECKLINNFSPGKTTTTAFDIIIGTSISQPITKVIDIISNFHFHVQ